MASSTLGILLRALTVGHVRLIGPVLPEALRRAWAPGAVPGANRLIVDLDSTICEVCGKTKHGAGYGYTKKLRYHPRVATRAGTGEVIYVRMRFWPGGSDDGHFCAYAYPAPDGFADWPLQPSTAYFDDSSASHPSLCVRAGSPRSRHDIARLLPEHV